MTSNKAVTKKVINSPETCVDDSLYGVVAAFPSLRLHPKHRVVTVRSLSDSGRVAVLGGGGSGHEPFSAGLVGSGMLDGAVAGGIFASPPTGNVLYAIAYLHKYNSGGVLVIMGNYTGDRLNFGKAIEKAKLAGMKVEGLIVGEDVASSHNKTGGRSMCGEVFFYKLCGALAAKGYDLITIRNTAIEMNKYMATLGVCLSACSLPGQPPLFEISADELELGVGVHGEAGIKKMKLGTAKEIVHTILDEIFAYLKLSAGDRVTVMVNNLGGTSFLEMNIINAETKRYLNRKQLVVERIFSGQLKTSLDMHGFQICLFNLDKQQGDFWLSLLDYPTDVANWNGSELSCPRCGLSGDDETILQTDGEKTISGPSLSSTEQELMRGCLEAVATELISHEELLNRLDSGCGDGDCGNTLKKFSLGIQDYLKTASLEYPANVLWDLSEIAETDMGGTSGGIYSLGLAGASKTLSSASKNSLEEWLSAWQSAIDAISKYGGAEPGDRTMLDALHAAMVVFKQNLNEEFKVLLQKTADAADEGAKNTAKMTARAGRASYVSAEYLTDEDAGARGVALWIRAIVEFLRNKY